MTEPLKPGSPEEAALEQRMHKALKAAWPYVNSLFTSNSAKNELRPLVEAESVAGLRVKMLFALQTAWPFVHGSGNKEPQAELGVLLGHGACWERLRPARQYSYSCYNCKCESPEAPTQAEADVKAYEAGWHIGHFNGQGEIVCPNCTSSIWEAIPMEPLQPSSQP